MAYVRKTRDVYCIETNYGYGWEIESEYNTFKESKADLPEYRIAVRPHFGVARIKKRRERIV